jgi:alpha-beta hydrolase superfamily lysophospholipase
MKPLVDRLSNALRLALLALALAGGATAANAQTAFYAYSSDEAVGAPGTLIRAESMRGAPLGASAYRVLYRSVGLKGEPIAVSGVVVVPAGPAPSGGRQIVAWAHPTTGIVPRCAPSLAYFVFQSMPGLRQFLAAGDIVVATDYPGLGTAGPHPYLIGVSEGRAVLDAVRVAKSLPGARAGYRFALWGHSQGGQAALFAAQLASSYAPELELTGVAVAAPATELQTLLRDDFGSDGGRNLTAMSLWSWSRVYGLPLEGIIDPSATQAVDALANECIESVFDMVERHYSQEPLAIRFLTVPDVTTIEPWRSLMLANIPGKLPANIPVFIAQGDADTLVLPSVTRSYMQELCTAGSRVELLSLAGVGHGFVGRDSAAAAAVWIADRFAGLTAPDDCGEHVAPSRQGPAPTA